MHGHNRTATNLELAPPPVLQTAYSEDVPRIIYTKSISNLRYRDQSLKTGEILILEYYAGFLSAGYGEVVSPLGWLRYHQANASGHPEMSRSTWNRHSKSSQEKGYIYRQVNKTGKHRGCSTIKFTQKFIDIVRKADIKKTNKSNVIPFPTSSHTDTQGPKWSPSSTDQRSLPEVINKSESRVPARELSKNSNQEKKSRQSHVPERPTGYPRELNSPMWWLNTCNLVSSEAEKIILQAKLIEHQNHEDISYWLANWKQRSEYDRSFAIRNIIKTLRATTIPPVASPSSSSLPLSSPPPSSSESIPEATKLLSAMVFGQKYDGPGKEIIERYKALDESLKPLMLQDIRTGKIKISDLEQPAASHPE
jgi:hypothetical protein